MKEIYTKAVEKCMNKVRKCRSPSEDEGKLEILERKITAFQDNIDTVTSLTNSLTMADTRFNKKGLESTQERTKINNEITMLKDRIEDLANELDVNIKFSTGVTLKDMLKKLKKQVVDLQTKVDEYEEEIDQKLDSLRNTIEQKIGTQELLLINSKIANANTIIGQIREDLERSKDTARQREANKNTELIGLRNEVEGWKNQLINRQATQTQLLNDLQDNFVDGRLLTNGKDKEGLYEKITNKFLADFLGNIENIIKISRDLKERKQNMEGFLLIQEYCNLEDIIFIEFKDTEVYVFHDI